MRLKILTCFFFILLAQEAMSQGNINGRVFDVMDSLYLPYVTIINLDTKDTTESNLEGHFSIKADIGDQLLFRYLGFVERTITLQNLEFLEVGLKPWVTQDDFGFNRLYVNSGYDFHNNLWGSNLEYISDHIFGRFYLRPTISYYFGRKGSILNSALTLPTVLYQYPIFNFGIDIQYQRVSIDHYQYENTSIIFQPKLRYFLAHIGIGNSKYSKDNQVDNLVGLLIGISDELVIGNSYLPIELEATLWGKNIQYSASLEYSIYRWVEIGLGYQHYRDFNSLVISIGYSIRLWKKIKNEY